MNRWPVLLTFLTAAALAGEKGFPITPIADMRARGTIDFARDVVPVLRRNCFACHNHQKPKADLDLEDPAAMRKGGESGPAIVPGKGEDSMIVQVSCGKHADYYMPPNKNTVGAKPLTPEELGLIKLWIDQGAKGEAAASAPALEWKPIPTALTPIYAVDLTADGLYAACARANQIQIYDVSTGQLSARLIDPELTKAGLANAADHDYIQAVAFSPDGTLLASGGYRCIRLWRKQPLAQLKKLGDSKNVKALAIHAPGNRVAKGFADGHIEVCDANSAQQFFSIPAHTATIQTLAYSNDGTLLLSSSSDRTLRIWSAANGARLAEILDAQTSGAFALNSDSKQVLIGHVDGRTDLFALPQTNDYLALPSKEFKGHNGAVNAFEWLRNGAAYLTAGADNGAVQWNFPDAQVRRLDHGAPVAAVTGTPDMRRFATAGGARLRIFNGENGQQLAEVHGDRTANDLLAQAQRDIAFWKSEAEYQKNALATAEKDQKSAADAVKKAADGKTATDKDFVQKEEAQKKALAEKDTTQKAMQAATDELKKVTEARDAIVKDLAAANETVKQATQPATDAQKALEKSLAEKAAAEKVHAELDAKTKLPDEKARPTPDALKASAAKVEMLKLAADRDTAKAADAAKKLSDAKQAADALSAKTAERTKAFNETTTRKNDADGKFKPAEKAFADADTAFKAAVAAKAVAEHAIELADELTKKAAAEIAESKAAQEHALAAQKQSEELEARAKKDIEAGDKPIRCLAASPNNGTFAAGLENGLLAFWGTERGTPGERVQLGPEPINALRYLDDERLVVATDAGCFIWRPHTSWALERVIGSNSETSTIVGRVESLSFSPDGKVLASGGGVPSRAGEVKLFNVADGAVICEFKDVHSDTVYGVAYSPDGKRLATCGADRFVRVLDIASGKLVKNFEGHTHHALGVSWKRDGRTLASAGADKTIKLWDMITGEQKKNLENMFRKEVTSVHYILGQNTMLASGDTKLAVVKEEGGENRNFGGEKTFLQSGAISADGKIVIGGGEDGTLRVFDSEGRTWFTFDPPK